MKITISKRDVMQEVEKQSSLVAATLGGEGFDELWASEGDRPLLDSFWIEGCSSAVHVLMRYIRNDSVQHNLSNYDANETLEIKADMPDTFNDFLIGSIVSSLTQMIVCNVMAGWLKHKQPELAKDYEAKAEGYIVDVRDKLLYRVAPYQNRTERIATDIETQEAADFFITKDEDNLNFKQYEKCNDNH